MFLDVFFHLLCMFTVCCDYRFSLVASKRACIYPNVGFQLQLCLFEKLDKDFDEVLIQYTYISYVVYRSTPSYQEAPSASKRSSPCPFEKL